MVAIGFHKTLPTVTDIAPRSCPGEPKPRATCRGGRAAKPSHLGLETDIAAPSPSSSLPRPSKVPPPPLANPTTAPSSSHSSFAEPIQLALHPNGSLCSAPEVSSATSSSDSGSTTSHPLGDARAVFEALVRHSVTAEVVSLVAEVLRSPMAMEGSRIPLDYYAVLGLEGKEDCSMEAISNAYSQEAMRWLPESFISDTPEAGSMFDKCTAAYEVLRNKDTRSSYDALLAVARARQDSLQKQSRQHAVQVNAQSTSTSSLEAMVSMRQ